MYNGRMCKKVFLALLILCSGSYVAPPGTLALDSIHTDIVVHEDSSVTITENIYIESGDSWFGNHFVRSIDAARRTLFGLRYEKGFELLECLRDGKPDVCKVSGEKGVWIDVGDYIDTTPVPQVRTYKLKYRMEGLIDSYGDADRLSWTVTERYWGWWPISASSSVKLTVDASAHLIESRMIMNLRGEEMVVPAAGVIDENGVVQFFSPRRLDQDEGFTISLAWPRGYIKEREIGSVIRQLAAENRGVPIGIAGLAVLLFYYLIVWISFGRGPAKGTIVVRYEPPRGMSPAVMRYIWKMGFDNRCLTAALLDMAAKGHLKIMENSEKEYVMTRTKGSMPLSIDEEKIIGNLLPKGGELKPEMEEGKMSVAAGAFSGYLKANYEKIFFLANLRYIGIGLLISAALVVGSGLGNLRDPFEMAIFIVGSAGITIGIQPFLAFIPEFLKRWKSALASGGSKGLRFSKAIIFTIVAAFFSFAYGASDLLSMIFRVTPYTILFIAAAAFINYAFYQFMKAPTRAGRSIRDEIEGFREFFMMTEKDRLKLMNNPEKTPELFSRYLPYALALDVEEKWSEEFSDVLGGASVGELGSQAAVLSKKGGIAAIIGNMLRSG